MFYLICFDIVDDRIREKVVKILKGSGYRVQKSVFECPNLTEHQFLQIKDKIEQFIDFTEDNVRYYKLCKNCLKEFEYSGLGEPPEIKNYKVI